jgi:hypothetical protein
LAIRPVHGMDEVAGARERRRRNAIVVGRQ